MKQFFKFTLASFTGLFLGFIILFFISIGFFSAIASFQDKEVKVKSKSILVLKLDNQIVDRASNNPLENLDIPNFNSSKKIGLTKVLVNIKKAKGDKNIKGILLNLSGLNAGLATIREIRNALEDYKDSTHFLLAYSDNMSQGAYYLATVADKVYLQPEATFDFHGFAANIMFYTGLMEKLGIQPEIIRHGKFKSAVEPFMLKKMSEANRLQTQTFVNSMWNTVLSDISKSRNIPVEKIQEFADNKTMTDVDTAVEYGLIDKALYRDELIDLLKEKAGIDKDSKLRTISLSDYSKALDPNRPKKLAKDKIAVIYAQGSIAGGENSGNIGSETILQAFRKARENKRIKAVVFRVNSPGGSALASDIIWREVLLTKKVKPVVVSMGDYAASGGYYISCAADSIFADPTCITGSIGVFGLMFNAEKLFNEKLNLYFDGVKTAKHADAGGIHRALTQEERDVIQKSIEKVYDTFVTHVSEGRGISKDSVDAIGQGRVWTGADAIKLHLIDNFGGLQRAMASAAALAKLDKYRVVEYPKLKTPMEQIMEDLKMQTKVQLFKWQQNPVAVKYMEALDVINRSKGIQALMPYKIIFE